MKFIVAVLLFRRLFADGALTPAKNTSLREREISMIASRSNSTEPEHVWDGWTSSEPDSTDYPEETWVAWMPWSIEGCLARLFCLVIASSPLLLAGLAEEHLTRTHLIESVALMVWLGGTLYLFCNVLKFQSSHWTGTRPLLLSEAVYLMAQILTTVGYGDITPAYSGGQVWVGVNVVVGLCLYGSMLMEVIGIVQARVAKATKTAAAAADNDNDVDVCTRPLKNWLPSVDNASFFQTVACFVVMVTIGVIFYANFPGENKTYFQAVYFSIITLSTVGFGAFTALTLPGKVFGAFWMLFGVASLGALIGGFVQWMSSQKEMQSFYLEDHERDFESLLQSSSSDGNVLTKTEFLEFAVKLTKGIDDKEIQKIKRRWQYLQKQENHMEDWVSRMTLVDFEGPPL